MLRHINCISREENYASGGVSSEDTELKCTYVSTLGAWPLSRPLQAGMKGAHFPSMSVPGCGGDGSPALTAACTRTHIIVTAINKFTQEAGPGESARVCRVLQTTQRLLIAFPAFDASR